jgi:hypothetical protein
MGGAVPLFPLYAFIVRTRTLFLSSISKLNIEIIYILPAEYISMFGRIPEKRAITFLYSIKSRGRLFIERCEINSPAHRRSPSSIPGQSM